MDFTQIVPKWKRIEFMDVKLKSILVGASKMSMLVIRNTLYLMYTLYRWQHLQFFYTSLLNNLLKQIETMHNSFLNHSRWGNADIFLFGAGLPGRSKLFITAHSIACWGILAC